MRRERIFSGMVFPFAFLMLLNVSCKRAQNCATTTRDFAVVQFVDSIGTPKNETFTITSVTSDSILVGNGVTSSTFNLPLDPFKDNVTFIFASSEGENWLALGYRNVAFISSEDCGPEFAFSDLTIWGSSYDSLVLVNTRLLDGIEINVRIYD